MPLPNKTTKTKQGDKTKSLTPTKTTAITTKGDKTKSTKPAEKTTPSTTKVDKTKSLTPTKTTAIPRRGDKTKSLTPAEKTTTSTEKVVCKEFPIKKDEIFALLNTDEHKKQFEKNYNAHMGFVAGVENKDIVSILAEGYKSNKQLADEGKTVSKKDAGKEGYKYVYLRFAFRNKKIKETKIDPEKYEGKEAEIKDVSAMAESLFSVGSHKGAWIFVPKRNIMQYEPRHVKSFDVRGQIIPPELSDFARVYSANIENIRGNEIAFDGIPAQDIKYFASIHNKQSPKKNLEKYGTYVCSYSLEKAGGSDQLHIYKHLFYEEKPLPDGADFE